MGDQGLPAPPAPAIAARDRPHRAEGVQHRAHHRDREEAFEIAGRVPVHHRDRRSPLHSEGGQPRREPPDAAAQLAVVVPAAARVHDLALRRAGRRAVQQVMEGERIVAGIGGDDQIVGARGTVSVAVRQSPACAVGQGASGGARELGGGGVPFAWGSHERKQETTSAVKKALRTSLRSSGRGSRRVGSGASTEPAPNRRGTESAGAAARGKAGYGLRSRHGSASESAIRSHGVAHVWPGLDLSGATCLIQPPFPYPDPAKNVRRDPVLAGNRPSP